MFDASIDKAVTNLSIIGRGRSAPPGYAVTKYALQLLMKKHGYDENLTSPDARLRAEKRRRTVL
jgi:hypothetical protein